MDQPTELDEQTLAAERAEARSAHGADRPANEEESEAAEDGIGDSDDERQRVAEHEREMNEIGAHAKGEGAIE